MVVVELFAGAGGASLGLVAAGMEEVRAVEWNHDACETRRAAGLRTDEGDVRDPAHYAGVTADAVWSSFPCQAWSTAGKRLGKNDPRNGWPWTVDVLDQVKPTWFMAENVPGLTHHRGACKGRCVDTCPRLYFEWTILRQLGERFAWVDWRILDAARFGVPQNRARLFIVAGPRPIQWPRETHAPPEELRLVGLFSDERKPWRTVREALGLGLSLIGQRTPETARGNNLWRSPDDPAPTIPAQADCVSACIIDRNVPQSRRPMRLDTPADTIQASGEGPRPPCITLEREDPSRGWEPHGIDEPSPAVRAGRPGGGLRVTTSRTGRKRIEYDLRQPSHSRGASDAVRRHPVEHGDAPASTLGALRPVFVLTSDDATGPRILVEDPKHPHVRPDAPAPALRSGGAGHSAPPMWLRTEMTGACASPDTRPALTVNGKGNTCVHPSNPGTRAASRPELLDKPSPTVTAVGECKGSGDGGNPEKMQRASDALWLGAGIRRLTVEECAALMAWPDGYPLRGTKTSQYAQVGNGCTPPVVEALARAVIAADKDRP